jgi:hypothetical protein
LRRARVRIQTLPDITAVSGLINLHSSSQLTNGSQKSPPEEEIAGMPPASKRHRPPGNERKTLFACRGAGLGFHLAKDREPKAAVRAFRR